MVRKTVSQAPIYVRDSLTRAARMAGAGDFDGAVEVLWPVICKNPEVPVIYDKLREYELGKLKTLSGGVKFWATFCGVFKVMRIGMISSNDPVHHKFYVFLLHLVNKAISTIFAILLYTNILDQSKIFHYIRLATLILFLPLILL